MSALTSLLVRDRVVSVSKIEEALHSQVFHGGDIEVILLEMSAVAEDVLSAYRAALFDLLPATRDEVMKARDVARRVPLSVARSLGIVPIFFEGRTLVVAAWEPLLDTRKRELEAQLGWEITVRIVNQVRLQAALAHHYNVEIDARVRKVAEALRRRDPGIVPYVRPPSDSMRPIARPKDDDDEGDSDAPPVPKPAAVPAEASALKHDDYDGIVPSTGGLAETSAERTSHVELPPEYRDEVPTPVPEAPSQVALEPLPLAAAMEALQTATQRDEVLTVLLRYVQQFFDFACIFSVAKEGVRARLAHGAGLPRDLVEQVFVPNPNVGLLADVIRSKKPQLGYLGSSPEEHPAATLLHRELGRLGLAVPVELAQRVVLIVYADRVGSGLSLQHAEAVQRIVPAVCTALRRLILDAKTRASAPPGASDSNVPSGAPPSRDALADRAIARLREASRAPKASASSPAPVETTLEAPSSHEEALDLPAEPPAEPLDAATLTIDAPFARDLNQAVSAVELEEDDEEPSLANVGRASQSDVEAELDAARAAHDAQAEAALADFEAAAKNEGSESGELSAVDLDAFERLIREDTTSDLHRIQTSLTRDPNDSAMVRERIAGVPRSAPPPPRYEPAPPPAVNNGYRYRGSAGLAQERLRVELAAASTLPLPENGVQGDKREPEAADRTRLSLVGPAQNEPSVIIDMGESVDALVAALRDAPPGNDPREIDELLQIGESALPVLMQHFPGKLWFDRSRPHRRRPRGRDVSAVARAVTAFGDRAAPYLASVIAGNDNDRAFYALLVAGEIIHADLLDPIARRVLDRDESLRALALEVLRSYAVLPQYDVVLRAISDLTERPGKDARRQRVAVEALGALRDPRTLRTLLARLGDRDEEIVQAAHDALVVLTGQDFGFAARKWESWVEGWGRAHRVEWLIESLMHGDENVRTIAGEELKQLTQQYFGYHPGLSKREREVVQRKYREWWEFEGRLNFR